MDRPIIFSAPMVQALLDGRKTQTRRLAWQEKECPGGAVNDGGGQMDYIEPSVVRSPSPWQRVQRGDRLWVREAWRTVAWRDDTKPADLPPDSLVSYEADYDQEPNDGCRGRLRPPIHMPRWASRITLTVSDVRVQPLQEISGVDAEAEGWDGKGDPHMPWGTIAIHWFMGVWGNLHGDQSWIENPEVVALTFTVRKGNIDA